jgi:uncharacterized surface protein with fasciclin (FAS1) repeats
LPPTTTAAPTTTLPDVPVVSDDASPAEILSENPDHFGIFWDWVVDADLDDILDEEGEAFTIFAPTNDALADVDPPTDPAELEALVGQYIVTEALDTGEVFDGNHDQITAIEGTIEVDSGDLTVGGANVVFPDLEATGDPNGFVHGIDSLFVP